MPDQIGDGGQRHASRWSWGVLLLFATQVGCAGAPTPAPRAATRSETVHVVASVPPALAGRGTVIAIPYSSEEALAGQLESANFFGEMLRRLQIVRDVDAQSGSFTVQVEAAARPGVVVLIFDSVGLGLDGILGSRSGLATARLDVPDGATTLSVALEGTPYAAPTEDCDGEREELVVLDAPETRREDDDGQRAICVRVPVSYASSPDRRYPIALVFPGYQGLATRGNVWRASALFDSIGAELGIEAIVVGVATRTAEGTSYLQRSERFGDWDTYLSERLLTELDARYRSTSVRGAIGHSTGGWNAMALATRHPDQIRAVASSSPDPLDLDAWMFDGSGAVRPDWLAWVRGEEALGRSGQFVSWAAAWSPAPDAVRGFEWPIDVETGLLRTEVFDRWRDASPIADLSTADGLTRARALSGRVILTAGRADEFGLFEPTERYARALATAGVETEWIPTDLGHFGSDEARFAPLVRFLLEHLQPGAP